MLPRSPARAAGASPLAAQGDCSLGEGQAPVARILLLLSVMSSAQIKEILSCLIPLGADIHDHIQPCSQGNAIAQTSTTILPRQFGFVARNIIHQEQSHIYLFTNSMLLLVLVSSQ